MKRTVSSHIGMVLLACASLAPMLNTSRAASLTPIATGDAVVGATGDRANLALASGGGVPFSSSDLTDNYASDRVNDGVNDNTGNSWISLTTGTNEYVGVTLPGPSTISAMVFDGETGYGGRSAGTWSLQYTLAADPATTTSWTEIGEYVYSEPTCAQPMPRSLFSFPAIKNVTGIRLVLKNSACINLAVQELEAYSPFASPVVIATQPTGATVIEYGDFMFTVEASNAEFYQWLKGGEAIAGATSLSYYIPLVRTNDAGGYSVIVSNAIGGAVTSATATLKVTAAPVYTNYAAAVLADKPIHYYPLDETNGTTAADLGTLATTGGTYAGGITLGQPAPDPRMGTAPHFDGVPGTLVDLGLFHPGDNFSVETWAKLDPNARQNPNSIVARWDGSYEIDFGGMGEWSTAYLVGHNQDTTFISAVGPSISARGQWHHLVGIFNGGVITIYVDGVKGSESNPGGTLQDLGPTPDRVLIGATRTGTVDSYNFLGQIDEVAIYNFGLSVAQIRAHIRAAQPAAGPAVAIQQAVLVSWPSFPPGYVLESAAKVDGPYQAVTNTPSAVGDMLQMVFPRDLAQSFFRLIKP